MKLIHKSKSAWLQLLTSLDHEEDDPGTVWNKEARERDKDRMSPRQAWRAIQSAMPDDVIISSDIGNNCAIGNAYPTFEKGRKYLAPGLFGPCGYGFPSMFVVLPCFGVFASAPPSHSVPSIISSFLLSVPYVWARRTSFHGPQQ